MFRTCMTKQSSNVLNYESRDLYISRLLLELVENRALSRREGTKHFEFVVKYVTTVKMLIF
jgi:hypothetical protein